MNNSEITILAENGSFNRSRLHGTIQETHISWVILTKHFAFKIKKPVKLSFLDFSTITKRKKFCEREVQLNRRLSNIYMNVVPVYHNRRFWNLGDGKGEIKDYAVRMKRMRSDKKMDTMLRRRQVKKKEILSLAKTVASFHKKSPSIDSPFDIAEARAFFNDILSIRRFIHGQLGQAYSVMITQAIRWSDEFLRIHAASFQDRIVAGFKRDVHGDLHSGNIFLYAKPVIFDCIEFNDRYRQIDVINEIAFFCMDLEANRKKSLSNLFVKEYMRHFSCFRSKEDEQLFTYFKCYRANVRAKVNAIRAQQSHDEVSSREYLLVAQTYFELMRSYMGMSSARRPGL